MQRQRLFGASGTVWVLLATLCVPAAAEAASCAALKAELASLNRPSAKAGPAARKWQTAHEQQSKAIAAAERDAHYFRCSADPASPKCTGLLSKIGRMQRNLRAIDRKLAKTKGGGSKTTSRIRQLQAKLQRQNCNRAAFEEASQPAANRRGGLFSKIFDAKAAPKTHDAASGYKTLPNGLVVRTPPKGLLLARSRDGDMAELKSRADLAGNSRQRKVRLPSGGTFRTLCVRTCDGYFFPVSFATGKDQFADDAARCGEICPAAPTELFVHRNPGGMQDEMVSLAGIPYADMENAYRYKTEFVQNCSCRNAQETAHESRMTPIAGNAGVRIDEDGRIRVSLNPDQPSPFLAQADDLKTSIWSKPPLLPDQIPSGADPATRMDLQGGFNTEIRIEADVESAQDLQKPAKDPKALPLLASQSRHSETAPKPVFASPGNSSQTRQASSGPIRKVGPEYFVAQ